MEYLFAFLVLLGMWALTPIASGIFGILIPLLYVILGLYFGLASTVVGVGGLCGSLGNIFFVSRYIETHGALSHSPRCSLLASVSYILSFIAAVISRTVFELQPDAVNYWILLMLAFIAWPVLSLFLSKTRRKSADNLFESVQKYQIVEKYDDDPRWATYVYLRSGEGHWNQTIPGSFRAKDPVNDLTFVFETKEMALRYAQSSFKNAVNIETSHLKNK